MGFNKRILKSGALAVVATIAFAIFVFRAAEWSKGLNSEVIVLGQGTNTTPTCTTTGGTGGSGTGSVAVTKVIPQIAVGTFDGGLTKYSTVIQVVNTSGAVGSLSANFYRENGAALDNVSLSAGTATITSGVLASTNLAKDTVLVISGSGGSAGSIGWGKLTTCGSVSISTFFELRDGATNVLYSRVGVAASPANMSKFVIPRVRDVAAGLDVAFALVNTGTASATLTATLFDAAGASLATKDVTLTAGSHQALFTQQFFGLTNEPSGKNYQYVKFSSASASFAAIALAFEGGNQTSFPVDVLQ